MLTSKRRTLRMVPIMLPFGAHALHVMYDSHHAHLSSNDENQYVISMMMFLLCRHLVHMRYM